MYLSKGLGQIFGQRYVEKESILIYVVLYKICSRRPTLFCLAIREVHYFLHAELTMFLLQLFSNNKMKTNTSQGSKLN